VAPRFQRLPPEQIEQAIRTALAGVLEAMDMDRISITEFSMGSNSYRFSYAHWRPGLPPLEDGVEKASTFPWYAVQAQMRQEVDRDSHALAGPQDVESCSSRTTPILTWLTKREWFIMD